MHPLAISAAKTLTQRVPRRQPNRPSNPATWSQMERRASGVTRLSRALSSVQRLPLTGLLMPSLVSLTAASARSAAAVAAVWPTIRSTTPYSIASAALIQ